jgi:hypothetical protein
LGSLALQLVTDALAEYSSANYEFCVKVNQGRTTLVAPLPPHTHTTDKVDSFFVKQLMSKLMTVARKGQDVQGVNQDFLFSLTVS